MVPVLRRLGGGGGGGGNDDDDMDFASFLRASTLVASRCFHVDHRHGDAMVPLADIFNHRTARIVVDTAVDTAIDDTATNKTNTTATTTTPTVVAMEHVHLESSDEHQPGHQPGQQEDLIEIRTVRPVAAGREVFNTYGDHSTAFLLLKYGFVEGQQYGCGDDGDDHEREQHDEQHDDDEEEEQPPPRTPFANPFANPFDVVSFSLIEDVRPEWASIWCEERVAWWRERCFREDDDEEDEEDEEEDDDNDDEESDQGSESEVMMEQGTVQPVSPGDSDDDDNDDDNDVEQQEEEEAGDDDEEEDDDDVIFQVNASGEVDMSLRQLLAVLLLPEKNWTTLLLDTSLGSAATDTTTDTSDTTAIRVERNATTRLWMAKVLERRWNSLADEERVEAARTANANATNKNPYVDHAIRLLDREKEILRTCLRQT